MDDKSKGTYRNFAIYCFLVFVSLFLFFTSDNTSFFNRYTQLPLTFWQTITSSTAGRLGETVNAIGELSHLKTQLEEAQNRIRSLEEMQAGAEIFQAELLRLKEQMNFYKESPYNTIPAQIIAKEPYGSTGIFTIDKGERDGIGLDFPVIAYGEGRHALIGKIYQLSWNSAQVIPLANASSHVSARFLNARYEGLVSGDGLASELLRMDYIPKEALRYLKIGETVVTSGMGGLYPPNILIGTLKSIKNDEHVPYLTSYISPAILPHRLEYIFVVQPQIRSSLDEEKD